MKNFWLFCLILIVSCFAGCASAIKSDAINPVGLKIYTEAYPPLNFAEEGKATGLATEVVQELMNKTRTNADIQVIAWDEGYKAVMEKPNVALFTVAMTPELSFVSLASNWALYLMSSTKSSKGPSWTKTVSGNPWL